jgi:hypothetical protein
MNYPKVKFELPTLKKEEDIIFDFCHEMGSGMNFSATVYDQHPDLKRVVLGITDEKEFRKKCNIYVDDYIEKNKKELEEWRENFQKSWEQVEDNFLINLSKDFETDFPEDIKEIKANVSINPICPRWLDKWTFNLYYKFSNIQMKQTTIHEIVHFFYFKKWTEVFTDSDKKDFDSPHSEWKLSEILVHPIMNNNRMIQAIIKYQKSDVYQAWQHIKIDGKKLVDYFEPFYKEHEEGKISFADFLKKSWEEYRKHKETIEHGMK